MQPVVIGSVAMTMLSAEVLPADAPPEPIPGNLLPFRTAAVPRWHMDMTYPLAASNATLDFWWSPYPSNITDSMQRILNTTARPDLVVASFCALLLHFVMNISDWSRQLDEVDAGVKVGAWDGIGADCLWILEL